tara:strand:- start:575 stop:961 length:387 start_codon:yes stop_codon:yes gene_type:complete
MNLDEKITEVKKALRSAGLMFKVQGLAVKAGLSVEEAYQYAKILQKMRQICMTFETQRAMRAKGYSEEGIIQLTEARELLVEAANCIHEMESMAYTDADPDDFAKHAMEFRGNVSEMLGADAPWGDEE